MARPDLPEPRPNALAEGNPVPNVLHGTVQPGATGQGGHEPVVTDQAQRRRWTGGARRRPGRESGPAAPRDGGHPDTGSDQPAGRVGCRPGCGCGGWLGLLVLGYLLIQVLGSCDTSALLADAPGPATSPPVGSTVDVDNLQTGDCFLWSGEADEVADVTAVGCREAHEAEVTGLFELPDPSGAAYDETAVTNAARERCAALLEQYTGGQVGASTGVFSSYIYPGEKGWQGGDRSVICLAEDGGSGRLTGSVRATDAP
jgi:hypothetical protein